MTSLIPEDFSRVLAELKAMRWSACLSIDEIGSPQRIAPHSVAIAGELLSEDEEPIATGRLILLHDPHGNDAWHGRFRLVTYVRASVDLEMVADPLLPDVAWSWFTDALESNRCHADALAGTVTASYGRGFGEMIDEEKAEVELRSSWTPRLDVTLPITPHLSAWQELLLMVAGQPPSPPELSALRTGTT